MTITKYIVLILFSILCLTILIKQFSTVHQQSCPTNNTFVVGTAAGYAPYVSVNNQGEYEGFDIDVAHELAGTLNKKLVIKDLGSMTSLMMALQQGSIEAIIWGISITQARQHKFHMIHYQGDPITAYPLIFWKNIPAGITDLTHMRGLTICAEPSSAQYDVLQRYPDITILPVEKVDDALLHIQYGTAIAALLDPAIAKKFKAIYPEIQILNVPLSKDDQVQGIGIVINQQNTALYKEVQSAVDILKEKHIISALEQKWNLS